jgi:hypothetical protein
MRCYLGNYQVTRRPSRLAAAPIAKQKKSKMLVHVFHRQPAASPSPIGWVAIVMAESVDAVFSATTNDNKYRQWWTRPNVIGAATSNTSEGDLYLANGQWYKVNGRGKPEPVAGVTLPFMDHRLYRQAIIRLENWLALRFDQSGKPGVGKDYALRCFEQRLMGGSAHQMADELFQFTRSFSMDSPLIALMREIMVASYPKKEGA